MGYGSSTKPAVTTFEKPHIFDTIEDPVELRKLVDDAIYLTGGQFAILCQFAKPALAEGSYLHSNFKYRILNRLQTTARFLNAAVMGTQREKEAIFSVIHRAHADVRGDNYSADDPELHRWTAATLFVSLIMVHETFFGKIPRDRMEKLYRETAVYGTSLRMPPEMWPATLDDFWAYWNHNIETLEITDWARSLAKDLLWPQNVPLWFKANAPVARLLTIHWLPERFQREFGYKVSPLSTGMFHLVAGYVAVVWPHVPKRWKSKPSKFYIKDMKKSVQKIEETGDWERMVTKA